MTGFALDWLSLRDPADQAARNRVVLAQVAAAFAEHDHVGIVDLGSGSGSTLRALSPHLPQCQEWTLIDDDPALLTAAAVHCDIPILTREIDLHADLGMALGRPADLVTASALLDLVSAEWLDRLVALLAARRLPLYAALSYDGGMQFVPAHPLDEEAVRAFNAHQTGEKGFGAALGAGAVEVASELLRARGAMLTSGRADWRLEPESRDLQTAFLEAVTTAIADTGRISARDLRDWQRFHRQSIEADGTVIRVGHLDLFARW